MPDEDDSAQVQPLDLADDVPDMGLLPGGHALLLGEARKCQRMDLVPGGAQLRRHLVPRPRPEPRTCHQHEVSHARKVTDGSDNGPSAPGPEIGGTGTSAVRASRAPFGP